MVFSRAMSGPATYSGPARRVKNALFSLLNRAGYFVDVKDGRYKLRRRIVVGTGDYLDVIRFAIGTPSVALILGAFEGNGVVHVANAFPNARVYAFEPDPITYETLSKNVAGYPNVIAVQAAVGDTDGTATLHRSTQSDINSLLPLDGEWQKLENEAGTPVRVEKVDTFCKREKLDTVDYIHADLQGFEMGMLRGATELLSAKRVKLVLLEVCLDPMYVGQSRFEELYAFMIEHGYRFVCTQGMFFEEGKPYPRGGNLIFVAA